jgi:hypothetical protein
MNYLLGSFKILFENFIGNVLFQLFISITIVKFLQAKYFIYNFYLIFQNFYKNIPK